MVDVIFIKMGNAVGIDEMGIIPTSDKATCLGFSQKLVDRLEVPITKTRSLRENLGVEIRWDNQGSYRGGVVELRVASMINYYGGVIAR